MINTRLWSRISKVIVKVFLFLSPVFALILLCAAEGGFSMSCVMKAWCVGAICYVGARLDMLKN